MSHAPPLNLADYEALAPTHMHPAVWDFISAGADDGVTMARNRGAFERIVLRPRVLADVSRIDTRTSVLGANISSPILIAPTGPHAALCPEGEVATAQAAARAGLGMIANSGSTRTIEEIASASRGPIWLQLYLFPERDRSLAFVRRAEAAGCGALVLTVDSPRFGRKEQSLRSEREFEWPGAGNLKGLPPATKPPIRGAPATWDDLDWLREMTDLPIVLKGVLTAEDTAMAVERNVAGIVVSNHGGRQLDGAIASIEALPEVVAAAGGRAEIYLDGGIRRGTDALKALALGARAVMIGRPVMWGLAVDGSAGALDVLEMLKRELESAMALAGRPTLADIDASLVRVPNDWR